MSTSSGATAELTLLRSVLANMPAAVVVADESKRIVLCNQAAETMLGRGATDEPPDRWAKSYGWFREDGEKPLATEDVPLVRALAGETLIDVQHVVRNESVPAGCCVSVSGSPIRDERGAVRGAVIVMRDVTARQKTAEDLRRTQEQLRHAQKMEAIGRLAGGVAHDFNNVIAAIMGYAHLLDEDLDTADPRREDVAEILRAANRATALTRQLLSLSHQRITDAETIELHEVVRVLEKMLRRVIGEDVDLKVELRATESWVVADTGQIEQVLMNLAVNARDAMPHGGKLTIETSNFVASEEAAQGGGMAPGRYVMLAVTDSGVGMDAATLGRIFEPFFTTKERERGTGLGLSTVYGIVQQSQGHIHCYSQPGRGTSFRVYFPLAENPGATLAPESTEEAERRESAPPAEATLLVVEDDEEVLRVASRVLRSRGYRVFEAASGEQARRICLQEQEPIHLLLSDIMLPDARGTELARQLVSMRPEMHVLYMSGYPSGALAHAGALTRETSFLEKPFSPKTLIAAVESALQASQSVSLVPPGVLQPRALVVDDDPSVRRVLVRLSQLAGLEVIEAADGAKAAALVASERFDVVVSDLAMPGMTGIELLREVRRHDLDVPVVLVTGAPDVSSASEAVQYGAFRYLGKPIDAARLHEVLAQALRFHRLARIKREALAAMGRGETVADLAGLEVRFERALHRSWLAFQPVVDVRHRGVYGYEALLRTDEPSMGSPMAMLAAAEQMGRVEELGHRVRQLVAEAASAAPPDSTLFVNVHADELLGSELIAPDSPLAALSRRVVLEITEKAANSDPAEVQRRVRELRALGYRIALDDIGTGEPGVSAFAQLEPEMAKIDRALVRHVHSNDGRRKVVSELVSLCHEMSVTVVAEGVETSDERDCLAALGCDLLQGYLFARPGPGFRAPHW